MARKRVVRRGRIGAGQTITPAATTIVKTTGSIGLTIAAGVANTFHDDTITISSTGNGAGFLISDDAAWLTVSTNPQSDGSVILTPRVDATSLGAGTYTGTITVTDARASNSPQTVVVSLLVVAASPYIGLLPQVLNFSLVDETASGQAQTVLISNAGYGAMNAPTVGTITYSGTFTNWVSSANITNNGDGTYTLTVTPTATGGTVGAGYVATIPIVSTGASNTPVNVTANLTVTSGATALLTIDRSLDDMSGTVGGSNPTATSVGIRSGNSTALVAPTVSSASYSGDHTGWATAAISGGTLTVTPNIGALSAGTGTARFTISDAAASNTVTYDVLLKLNTSTFPVVLVASPSGVSTGATNGTNALSQTITIVNGGSGGLVALGTVAASFTTTTAWCTPSYNSNTGIITLTFATSGLSNGTYNATLRVTGSLATNSPIDIPIQVIVAAASVGYPTPPADIILPSGWTWGGSGYPTGSCFDIVGPASAAGGARPPFSGTTYQIPETYATWALAMAAVSAGTIVPGDKISVRADQVIVDAQFPVIPGWSLGDEFICVQSRNMANLPAYSYANGPASYGSTNRGGKDAHLADMPKFKTLSTNQSCLNFQQGTGGWWLEGLDIWADTPATTSVIVGLKARNGVNTTTHNQVAHVPSGIVIDRCRLRSTNGHQNVFEGDARYWRFTHSTADFARRLGGGVENKFLYMISTDGHWDCLGNEFSGWGIGILIGGAEPTWQDVNPSDGMVMWNRMNFPVLGTQVDSDSFKNFYENKTGRRWCVAFNKVTNMGGRRDQRHGFIVKAVDQANRTNGVCNVPQSNSLAHVTDILYWCNYLHGAKAFANIADLVDEGCGVGGAIGTERICAGYNLAIGEWSTGLFPSNKYTLATNDRYCMALFKSNGDGIPGVRVIHNTFGSKDQVEDNAFLELDNVVFGSAFRDIYYDNNVMISRPAYGPIRGNQATNATAMNTLCGAGNWAVRRNLVMPGGALWGAALEGAGYNNGYLQSTSNFTDPSVNDYSLSAAHPAKNTGFGTNADPGYNHAYLTAMTSTVLTNTGV